MWLLVTCFENMATYRVLQLPMYKCLTGSLCGARATGERRWTVVVCYLTTTGTTGTLAHRWTHKIEMRAQCTIVHWTVTLALPAQQRLICAKIAGGNIFNFPSSSSGWPPQPKTCHSGHPNHTSANFLYTICSKYIRKAGVLR